MVDLVGPSLSVILPGPSLPSFTLRLLLLGVLSPRDAKYAAEPPDIVVAAAPIPGAVAVAVAVAVVAEVVVPRVVAVSNPNP